MSVPPPPGQPVGPPQPGQPYGPPPGGPPPVPPAGNTYGPPPGGGPPQFPPPGQPGGFAPPPGQPYGPPPGEPVKQRKNMLWLRIVVLVVVLGAAGVFGVIRFANSPNSSVAGDCLHIKEFSDKSDPSKVDCNDPTANVKIAVKLDSSTAKCPEGNYDEYYVTGRGTSYKLCLMPNFVEGDCAAGFLSETAGYQKVACSDPTAEVKVSKVAQGISDETVCDEFDNSVAMTYSEPKSTYCYTEAGKTST